MIIVALFVLDVNGKKKPKAISIPIRSKWLGYDGDWSPVSLRVGTPPVWVDLFVSTVGQDTLVVGADGCDGSQTCVDVRGGIFKRNESSTWQDKGVFYLDLDAHLGFNGQGAYGLDNIAIDNDTTVEEQVIGSINTTEHLLGYFGLGIQPLNLTGPDEKTFLSSMVENKSLIPSHSYGYTAGASYRLKGVPGSLVLGGTDVNRYRREHNTTFNLDPDQRPAVALNSITATAAPLSISDSSIGWEDNFQTLLGSSQASLFVIDSTTPFLWFPEEVCLQFEKALNLTYDDNLQLYTFQNNTKQHERLVRWNISFAFTLADLPGSSSTINFTLPYGAFDLKLTYPYPGLDIGQFDQPVSYFPLRKASNSTQYTIGRAFLQETYLIVDYERSNFSLFPATFVIDPFKNTKLVDITRPKNSTLGGPVVDNGPNLSKGTIAGIVIACILAVAFVIGLIFLMFSIRRARPVKDSTEEKSEIVRQPSDSKAKLVQWLFNRSPSLASFEYPQEEARVPELQAKETGSGRTGADSELDGTTPTLRGYFERDYQDEKTPYTFVHAIGHDPSMPVELPYRSSNYRSSRKLEVVQELAPSPGDSACPELPSARPEHGSFYRAGTKKSTAVSSPSEGEQSGSGNVSDPTQIVSPITPDHPDEVSSLETIARRAAWYVSNESPSISSESRAASPRSGRRPVLISGRAGFPARHSRQNTVSSLDRTGTPGTPSMLNFTSSRGSPSSYTKVPRNSRATNSVRRADSTTSGEGSETSTVTNVIRRSVQRGFSWLHPHTEEESDTRTTQPTTTMSEQSPYSPARWIEFWRTGRDPRLGPLSENRGSSTGG